MTEARRFAYQTEDSPHHHRSNDDKLNAVPATDAEATCERSSLPDRSHVTRSDRAHETVTCSMEKKVVCIPV